MAVSLSVGVRNALTSLQNTQALAQTIQNRLATGKKVNSALDNPASFFVAAGLQNRSSDLSRLLDDMGQGTKVLEAADKGISAIKKLIETAQGTLRQALQASSTTPKVTGSAATTGSTTLVSLGFVAADTITIAQNGGTAATTLTVASGSTVQNLIDGINQNTSLNGTAAATTGSGSKVKASSNANGQLEIESMDGTSLTVATTGTGTTAMLLGTGSATAAASQNAARTSFAAQFDALRTQIDQLSSDSGYNGVNLLKGDWHKVTFNESSSSSLTIAGVSFNSTGLGVTASTNNFQSDTDINNYLTKLTTASNTLRTQASTFGANLSVVQNRQDFTKGLINTLTTGADALTLADQNEEGASLLALQTRQQLSQTALSLSNQADQAVLRLFG